MVKRVGPGPSALSRAYVETVSRDGTSPANCPCVPVCQGGSSPERTETSEACPGRECQNMVAGGAWGAAGKVSRRAQDRGQVGLKSSRGAGEFGVLRGGGSLHQGGARWRIDAGEWRRVEEGGGEWRKVEDRWRRVEAGGGGCRINGASPPRPLFEWGLILQRIIIFR